VWALLFLPSGAATARDPSLSRGGLPARDGDACSRLWRAGDQLQRINHNWMAFPVRDQACLVAVCTNCSDEAHTFRPDVEYILGCRT
jgi:hypothetical protein